LLGVYLEAISKNSIIQAQLPNRLSIKTVNELLQAIESIFFPQSPDAIARRQSLFHKLTQGEGETTSALFNRTLLYFRMFEYTLRTKDLIDLIGCMYMTFKNRSLFVQTRDKCLSAAKNGRLDIQAISRNIVETESAMRDLGQTLADDALSEQLFFAHQDRKTCYICNLPGHIAARCPNRTAMGLDGTYTPAWTRHPVLRKATRYSSIPRPSSCLSAISIEEETVGDLENLGEVERIRREVEGPEEDAMAGVTRTCAIARLVVLKVDVVLRVGNRSVMLRYMTFFCGIGVMIGSTHSTFPTHMSLPMLCNASMSLG